MCFNKQITILNDKNPLIAKKNILVYKCISKDGYGVYYSLYINGIREKWKRGYHYIETTPFANKHYSDNINLLRIKDNTFHSSKTKKWLRYNICDPIYEYMVTMIIPKGALYYENANEYVSSEIIFPIKITDYVKIKR